MTNTEAILRDSPDEAWKDPDVMFHLYDEKDYTFAEIGDLLGCSDGTACTWMKRHRAKELVDDLEVDIPAEYPYRDRDLMKRLYVEEELSTTEIAAVLDCSTGAVIDWMDRHGIERRNLSEAVSISRGGNTGIYFYTLAHKGYEQVKSGDDMVAQHKLQAVAYWGFDEVADMQVHHKNGIEWDNRRENLELLTPREHIGERHGGNIWLDRLRAVEMYASGASSYDIAPTLEVSPGTVIRWVREFDPDLIRSNSGGAS